MAFAQLIKAIHPLSLLSVYRNFYSLYVYYTTTLISFCQSFFR
nr:MAG TPA: hypothetical protein [Caudoviricetes sp.]